MGEAEDDAEVVFIQQQRVDDDAIGRVHQGDGQRQRSASGPDTADQVGALVAVEDRHEHFGTLDRAFLDVLLDAFRCQLDLAGHVRVRNGVPIVLEDGADQIPRCNRPIVDAEGWWSVRDRRCVEVGVDELDCRIDAERSEDPTRDRVEERLG